MTGSSHDPATPSGNDLRSARGTFRLASSRLDFAQNPVQQPGEGHGGHGHGAEDGHHPAPSRPERDDDGNSLIQFTKVGAIVTPYIHQPGIALEVLTF